MLSMDDSARLTVRFRLLLISFVLTSNAVISRLDGAVLEERPAGDRGDDGDDDDAAGEAEDDDFLIRGATPAATSPSQEFAVDDVELNADCSVVADKSIQAWTF